MSMLGVTGAAAELGVSPRRVRQMLADGLLVGDRVGRAWVIDSGQLRHVGRQRRGVGRPWSPASAWAVLALADGGEPELSPVERSRAKKRLAEGLDVIALRLRARADQRWFYGHPGVLGRLADAGEVVRGGASAAAEHGADLVVQDGFEGYVRSSGFGGLVQQYGLDAQTDRPNVLLRVVDDEVWPFEVGQITADRAVVAIDLYESAEPRTRRAGAAMMERS